VHHGRKLPYNGAVFCPVCRSEYADDWKVCPKDAAHLLRSQFVGKYRIDSLLGAGGMGAVYKAFNPDTQSTVAVKLMHGGAAAADASRQRFQREAASVAALRTRHVVSIYDFGSEPDGTLYLVMEYLQGHALRNEIAPAPNLVPLPRVHFIFDQALRGLGAAHKAGIVHRDLKPENVFVADTDDGEVVKILDFGIARQSRGDTPNLTHSGALMGTPAYMAPEQVAGNRGQVGAHSDVYGMGVILYELLTGASPFHAETLSEVLSKILSRTFAPLAEARPDLPHAVYQLVERALSDDPLQRFTDAHAMREAWMAAWAQMPGEVRNATVPSFHRAGPAEDRPSGPAVGINTELPAGTPTARVRGGSHEYSQDALAATAAGLSLAGAGAAHPSTASRTGAAHPSATGGAFDPRQSVTPGPVVVTSPPDRGARSRTPLLVGGALLLAGGAAAAFLLTRPSDPGAAHPDRPGQDAAHLAQGAAHPDAAPAALPDGGSATASRPDAGASAPPPDPTPPGMTRIEGATFDMGVDERTAKGFDYADLAHPVTVAAFYLDKHEVTAAALGATDSDGQLPARSVTWEQARDACAKRGARLPTAAEWELAARGGPLSPKAARLRAGRDSGPAPVGTHPGDCTPAGVCDLLGNVMEWTADEWPGDSTQRVVRGASFTVSPTAKWYASIHARLPLPPTTADPEIGFRCAADAPASAP
jgi:serine/threonine-protein kinase